MIRQKNSLKAGGVETRERSRRQNFEGIQTRNDRDKRWRLEKNEREDWYKKPINSLLTRDCDKY